MRVRLSLRVLIADIVECYTLPQLAENRLRLLGEAVWLAGAWVWITALPI